MEGEELTEIALGAARAAVAVQDRHRGQVRVESWAEKGVADFVSFVDTEAEAAAVAFIEERCPGHAFLAEEASSGGVEQVGSRGPGAAGAGESRDSMTESPMDSRGGDAASRAAALGEAEWLWVIDPLDGTTNYLHGYPMYCASVAVLRRGEPVAGAVVSGVSDEAWTAWRGGGARLNGRAIHVSGIERLPQALIGTGFPFKAIGHLPEYLKQFDAVLRRSAGIRRAGSAALDLCHLATGYFDGFWELHLSPWDIAAGALIVREAGGIVTTLTGEADVLRTGDVLAGNPVIYEALATLLREVDRSG